MVIHIFNHQEPISGLLNKEYAKQRAATIQYNYNDSISAPGDPYPFEGKTNPYANLLKTRFGTSWPNGNKKEFGIERSVLSREEALSVQRSALDPEQEKQYQEQTLARHHFHRSL